MRPNKTQKGTRDLPRFLDDIAGRTNRMPKKLLFMFGRGPGGEVFRRMGHKQTKQKEAA